MIHAREDYNQRVQDSSNIIPKDEPVFLLRAQDKFAFETVMHWANKCESHNPELAEHVRNHAMKMKAWPKKKLPDRPKE